MNTITEPIKKQKIILMFSLFLFFISFLSSYAQAPQKVSYQSVIRNASNQLVANQQVGVKISIIQGSESGEVQFSERHTPTTNSNGLISVIIGNGTLLSGNFTTIDWANGPFFLKSETDPAGGTNYTITMTNQILSVPYALHAKTAETVSNETDPVFADWDKDYNDLTNIPSVFIPSSHLHNAGDITSGILNISRIPTGETSSTVALGNHTHANMITGSGANNRICIWNGTSSIFKNENLVWDNTNNRLGIGTNTPQEKIDVSGDILINNVTVGRGKGTNNLTNTALGNSALINNSTGINNSALGVNCLKINTSGYSNTAVGTNSMAENTIGNSNSALGIGALQKNTEGNHNSSFGGFSLINNNTGNFNVAVGSNALYSNVLGSSNVAVGYFSLWFNNGNSRSTAIGNYAMVNADSRNEGRETYNTAVGYEALKGSGSPVNNTGQYNTAVGDASLRGISSGNCNTALGVSSGSTLVSGSNNLLIGCRAGDNLTTGSNNVAIGYDIDLPLETGNHQMVIGNANTLYGDLQNNRIGIGTTSPGASLHIKGSSDGLIRLENPIDNKIWDLGYEANSSEDYFFIDEFGSARRFIIKNGGNVGIGTVQPEARLHIMHSTSNYGLLSENAYSTGTGVIGAGNNASFIYLVDGSGGAFTGKEYGVYGKATNTSGVRAGGYFSIGPGTNLYTVVSYVSSSGTLYKVAGNGSVSTFVEKPSGEQVNMFCPEAPEILLTDYGTGKLINGKCRIELDSIFSNNIIVDEKHPLRVFIQLKGDCNGVYYNNESLTGFDVIELQQGTSDVSFCWSVVANRKDEIAKDGTLISKNQNVRFPITDKAPEVQEVRKK